MWSHIGIQHGLNAAKHGASFIASFQEAKAKKAWQAYNNAMTNMANAENQSTITTNQNLAIERSTVQNVNLQISEYQTRAQAEAEAAAMGTTGRSVNQTLFGIERNATVQQSNRKADLDAQILGFDSQRRSSNFQTAQQIDHTVIPRPNLLSAALGFAGDYQKIKNLNT